MNFTHEHSISTDPFTTVTVNLSASYIYFCAYYINIIFGLPINSYVLWLIWMGTGRGIVAEFFSLNLTVCEIFFCLVSLVFVVANKFVTVYYVTYFSVALPTIGRPLINCVICFERYLAVLHPVSFLKYKPLRYKLLCSAVIWVLVFGCGVLCMFFLVANNLYMFICLYMPLFSVLLCIKLLCCLTIVRALKCPGPGEKQKEREEANHRKKKAVVVILIITVSMFIQYTPMIFTGLIFRTLSEAQLFLSIAVAIFLMFGYVSPALYIYRVRSLCSGKKLIKNKTNLNLKKQIMWQKR